MTRIVLLTGILFFGQFSSLILAADDSDCNERQIYRIKHFLLETSPWSGYPIIEAVPHLKCNIDSLQKVISRSIQSEIENGQIYLKFPLKFVVQCDGTITDLESLSRKRQDIADSLMTGIEKMPKWTPGTVQGKPVKTIVLITAILSGKNFYLEMIVKDNGSRLSRMNAPLEGTWIQYKKDYGTTDTLRITGNEYYLHLKRGTEESMTLANILEHSADSGCIKLQYRHLYCNLKEIKPISTVFYLTYSSSQRLLYTSQSDSTYPSRNLLEYNATCNVWKRQGKKDVTEK